MSRDSNLLFIAMRRSKDRPSFRVSFGMALCIAAGLVFLGWKAIGL
jgi:hypothetical protein